MNPFYCDSGRTFVKLRTIHLRPLNENTAKKMNFQSTNVYNIDTNQQLNFLLKSKWFKTLFFVFLLHGCQLLITTTNIIVTTIDGPLIN